MRKWLFLPVFFLLCLSFVAYGLDVPKLQGYVNDYAGLISPSAKAKIEEELREFKQSDSTQIVILTIPSLEGENIEEFGIKVAEAWKIGQQVKDNGVLFIGRCNRVTSSDGMNLSDVFLVSPHVRALPGSQNTPLRFLCQTFQIAICGT
jgi:hypothetical protein